MRDVKFKFVVENHGKQWISREYELDENGLPSEETVLEDMEECDCSLNESISVCEGDCVRFEDGKVIDKIQYIGIKDKTGVEIYEGDIVASLSRPNVVIVWDNEYARFWIRSHTHLDGPEGWGGIRHFQKTTGLVVIGNIYENSDLLDVNG